jgi:hypothetical protein
VAGVCEHVVMKPDIFIRSEHVVGLEMATVSIYPETVTERNSKSIFVKMYKTKK